MKRWMAALSLLLAANGAIAQDPNLQRGFKPNTVYQVNGLDSVNTLTGNLILRLPLSQTFRVGPLLSYSFTAMYNSSVWDTHLVSSGVPWRCDVTNPHDDFFNGTDPDRTCTFTQQTLLTIPSHTTNAGLGWSVSLGRIIAPGDPFSLTPPVVAYEFPDGHLAPLDQDLDGEVEASFLIEPRLRVSIPSSDQILISFPDGTTQLFYKDTLLDAADPWRLREIADPFGNRVQIDYTPWLDPQTNELYETWTVKELPVTEATPTRTHTLRFIRTAAGSDKTDPVRGTTWAQKRLVDIVMPGPGGSTATCTFHYTRELVGRNLADTMGAGGTQGYPINIYLLTKIDLPASNESYSMEKDTNAAEDTGYELCNGIGGSCLGTGQLKSLRVPTGGLYEWKYTETTLPNSPIEDSRQLDGDLFPPPAFTVRSAGVERRTLVDFNPAGQTTGRKSYWFYSRKMTIDHCFDTQNQGWKRPNHLATAVTAPDGTTTVTYYSVFSDNDPCNHSLLFNSSEYGLPITHSEPADGGLLLSSETYSAPPYPAPPAPIPALVHPDLSTTRFMPPGGILKRTTKLHYAELQDGATIGRSVQDERTYYNDASPVRFTETIRRDGDGFGHYRQISTGGDFGDGNAAYRTTFTNYLKPTFIGPTTKWIFDTYSEQCSLLENSRRTTAVDSCAALGVGAPRSKFSMKQFCFDVTRDAGGKFVGGTGLLQRVRAVRETAPGSGDIIQRFTPSPTGEVAAEEYFGGDDAGGNPKPMPAATETCTAGLGVPLYAINHTYRYGSLASSQYAGVTFPSVTRDIDQNTGLVHTDSDAAGITTEYRYDAAGRITNVTQLGLADVQYSYVPAGSQNASVTVTQTGGTDATKTETYSFDGFGRVVRELTSTETTGVLRGHDTKYDLLGRKTEDTTVALFDSNYPPTSKTVWSYDSLGRTTQVRSPAGTTTMEYPAFGLVRQTVSGIAVKDGGTASAVTEQSSDALGRLRIVTEPIGTTANEATTTTARYDYDVADRLTDVRMTDGVVEQHRLFVYDNLGFLREETHPELGTEGGGSTTYDAYDARGHLLHKLTGLLRGPFDLTFEYDAAERLKRVGRNALNSNGEPVSIDIKKYEYGDAHPAEPHSAGRLYSAWRHNTVSLAPVTTKNVDVTETYHYDSASPGLLVSKDTAVAIDGATHVFTQGYEHSLFGDVTKLFYPTTGEVPGSAKTVENLYRNSMLIGVNGYSGHRSANGPEAGITYAPNGMIAEITHSGASGSPMQKDIQTPDPTGAPRPYTIEFKYCSGPALDAAQPRDAIVEAGTPATLHIDAPAGAVAYQWYRGDSGDLRNPIQGATGPTYELARVTQDSMYWVAVRGADQCPSNSRAAHLTVRGCDTFGIATQPRDITVKPNETATFTVSTGATPARYEWHEGTYSSSTIVGGDSATLNVFATTEKTYWVHVTSLDGACSRDTALATLHICTNPVVLQQPEASPVAWTGPDTIVKTSVTVAGKAPFRYTWTCNNVSEPPLTTNEPVNSYSRRFEQAGSVTCHVDILDACGSVTSDSVILEADAGCNPLWVTVEPDIEQQDLAWPVTLTATASENDVTFAWFRDDDIPVTGNVQPAPNKSALTVQLQQGVSFMSFYVKVTKACGTVQRVAISRRAMISQYGTCPAPPVRIDPPIVYPEAGHDTTLRAVTSWPYGATYRWFQGEKGDRRTPKAAVANHPDQLVAPSSSSSAHYWVEITYDCGNVVESETAAVIQGSCVPVTIVHQPFEQDTPKFTHDVASGAPAFITIDAIGGNLNYTWYSVAGTTATQIGGPTTVPWLQVSPPVTTSYKVRVSNGCAADEESAVVTVHVNQCDTNRVTTQPAALTTTTPTNTANLSVVVAEPAGVSYQWYRGSLGDVTAPVFGATGAVFTALLDSDATFWVRITASSGCSFDSNVAKVSVCKPLVINPALNTTNTSIPRGTSTRISVNITGNVARYEWYLGTDTSEGAPKMFSTANRTFVRPLETQTYTVKAISACNPNNSVTWQQQVSVCPVLDDAPTTDLTEVMPGASAHLTIEPVGTQLHFQWYAGLPDDPNLYAIPNTDSATITTPPVARDTYYWVAVTSGGCTKPSQSVLVRLCSGVSATWLSTPRTVRPSEGYTLEISTSPSTENGATITWYRGNSGDVSGSTVLAGPGSQIAYIINPTETAGYWARVHRNNCYADTATLTIPVCGPPSTATVAGVDPVIYGQTATLTATADGTQPHYHWYRGSAGDISTPVATDSSTFTTPGLTGTTRYWVRVTNDCGSKDSSTVLITVILAPPTQLQASWTAATGMRVQWQSSAGADHYVVERYVGPSWMAVYSGGALSTTDNAGLASGRAYVYRVHAVDGDVNNPSVSANSAYDIATTITFAPVTSVTMISPAPFNEILDVINVIRTVKPNVAPLTWSEALVGYAHTSPPAGGFPIYADYVAALRQRMNEALGTLGVPTAGYAVPASPGSTISSSILAELQLRAQ